MTTRAAVHRRDGRRVTRFADDDFVQTRYNLRTADERYDTRDEDDYDYEQAGRRKASQPSPRVGQRRARSPSPVYARASTGRGSARRRETGLDTAMAKRGTAMARHRPVEDYVTHPLDDFDRYMLARRERGARPREHMRPAAREMERIAYMDSRRRGRPQEEEEEGQDQADEGRYSGDFSEDDVDYDRFRVQRQRHEQDHGEVRRGRQMIKRSDLVHRGSGGRDRRYEGEEEEGEEGEEGYDYDGAGLEMYQGESDEGEGLVSASDALDEDEEYITGRRMPLRSKRRLHDYDEDDAAAVRRAYTGRRMPQQQQHKRRRRDEEEQEEEDRGLTFTVGDEDLEEEEEQRRPAGRRRTRAQGAEEEEGGGAEDVQQRRQGRKLSSRQTHRHPTYEDMIAEALVKVGKNGKASGVAIFKYVHDHFDMPANDRLVRNHLHQAFERLIDSGQLRHKKASYVLPRNLLAQYDAKYGAKKDEEKENKEEGEKGPEGGGEADQGGDQVAQKEGQEGGAASEKQATEGVAPSSDKGASAGERQQQQHEKKASEEKADKSEETTTALTSKKAGGGGRKRSR